MRKNYRPINLNSCYNCKFSELEEYKNLMCLKYPKINKRDIRLVEPTHVCDDWQSNDGSKRKIVVLNDDVKSRQHDLNDYELRLYSSTIII